MHRTLQTKVQDWGDLRYKVMDEVQGLSPERLVAKPLPGKWSVIEIVEHLVRADRDVLQDLPSPADLVDRRRELKDRVRYPLVMFVLACHIPAKVPSPRMMPQGGATVPDLRGQWEEMHRWLRSYAEQLDQHALSRAVFAHPIAGPLTLEQAMHMGALHVATHSRQIRRLESLTN
jgi:hypothetical protein